MLQWEFAFYGKDGEGIHGIGLREAIRTIATKRGISGNVQNVKENDMVVVNCIADSQKAEEFFKAIISCDKPMIHRKIDSETSKMLKVSFEPQKIIQNSGFSIKKSDELSEMVWALQGAGKVFELQQETRKKSLENSLRYAINIITDLASEIKTSGKSERKFILIAVGNYIKECPTDDKALIANLYDLHQFCEKANAAAQIEECKKELDETLGKIIEVCSSIEGKLKS